MNEEFEIYVFLGKVRKEEDKLYYWKEFENLFHAINPIMSSFQNKTVYSEQVFTKLLKVTKDGLFKVTFKKAPTGGTLKWTKSNCQMICTKFLSDNEHLIKAFETNELEMNKMYLEKKGVLTHLRLHEISGSVSEKQEIPDFLFRLYPQYTWQSHYNQYINLFIKRSWAYENRGAINTLFKEIDILLHTIKSVKSKRNWDYQEPKGNVVEIDPLPWKTYQAVNSLDINENQYDKWQIIKEPSGNNVHDDHVG